LRSGNSCCAAPWVASGSYSIECQLVSRRSAVARRSSLLSANNRAASQLYLEFCSDRAPPAIS
jgi:hypothetical protein